MIIVNDDEDNSGNDNDDDDDDKNGNDKVENISNAEAARIMKSKLGKGSSHNTAEVNNDDNYVTMIFIQ